MSQIDIPYDCMPCVFFYLQLIFNIKIIITASKKCEIHETACCCFRITRFSENILLLILNDHNRDTRI